MIRVEPANEPESFDEIVRKPGHRAIAELVGEEALPARRGRPRKVVAQTREDIPADKFPPVWTHALPDLMEAYGRLCAYICIYIERVTGGGSVDHMLAKSHAWQDVYEWQNYRLACTLMNARKNNYQDVLDPFEVEDGWFRLELVSYQVIPGEGLDPAIEARVLATITRLKLNDHDCLKVREEYATAFFDGDIKLDYLRRRAPFLAREIEGQGAVDPMERQEELGA
ncbi:MULTISPECIES: hypothetical protein [Pseudomonas]|jgi:hypothetical protein|uniref:hypothetical protein n=1 Tax=Pseudomonas TaxID=286 RepID=UPI000FA7D138|nr:hypothetical protein [Pseudomonas chlororaphis]WDG45483.1 hypothetical protein PUP58_17110 [Pseudomonas chlororaphis]